MGNSLESNIVEVLKEVAKDVRSIRNSGSGAIATYDDIKHALNVKGYYCKDATLSSVLDCLVTNMSVNALDLTYERSVGKVVFTSSPHAMFSLDDVRYTIGEDGIFTYNIPSGKKVAKAKLYGYTDAVIKEFNVALTEDAIDFNVLLRDGFKIDKDNQYMLTNFKTKDSPKTYVITSTSPVNGDSNAFLGGIMWKLGASATDNMNIIIDGSAENYVSLNHKVRVFVRHTTQDGSRGTYNSPDRYITTDIGTPNKGLVSVYTEKLTEFVKKNVGLNSSIVQKMRDVYGVLGDDVLCGVYTLDGSEALVYRPSKVKFDYVSIV
jgi:hypothetical protein